ncbi:chorismate--pyruvate lyase family protein [Legionella sp. CNM-4043-24]|uniref:chorismate--pyruvate lyase family protein n=1 Tax=Legionella sp. CNM-4043-24 TaxID=3421646 RepID=UPI00403AC52A
MRVPFLPYQETAVSPPPSLLPWLVHTGPLTARLKKLRGQTRLQVIRQHWRSTNWWDQQVLGLQHHRILQRDILMFSHQAPCWFARSMIPEPVFTANRDVFDRLQYEALGDIVFSHDHVERSSLDYYPLFPDSIEYYWPERSFVNQAPVMWLRLSTFTIRRHYPFFLTELFLPEWVDSLT